MAHILSLYVKCTLHYIILYMGSFRVALRELQSTSKHTSRLLQHNAFYYVVQISIFLKHYYRNLNLFTVRQSAISVDCRCVKTSFRPFHNAMFRIFLESKHNVSFSTPYYEI